MFDVSLSELMVIGVVALVVIGPERLPRVARTLGHLLGKLQRYVGQVKADINREMQLDDLKKFQEQMAAEAGKIKASFTSVGDEISSVGDELRNVETTLKTSMTDGLAPEGKSQSVDPSVTSAPIDESPASMLPLSGDGIATASSPSAGVYVTPDDGKLPEPLAGPRDLPKMSPAATEKA